MPNKFVELADRVCNTIHHTGELLLEGFVIGMFITALAVWSSLLSGILVW